MVWDTSHYESEPDYSRSASDPPLLVITKLTEGKSFIDATAGVHIEGARSIGAKTSCYHFLRYNDIQGQVDNFLEAAELAGFLRDGVWLLETPPVLDVELEPTSSNDPQGVSFANQIKTWLDLVEQATALRPWIYTNANYWKQTFDRNGNPPPWTGDYMLWIAQYFDDPDLHEAPYPLAAGWSSWYLWQYSAAGIVPAFPYDGVDLNKASDGLLIQLGQIVTPPTGASMYKYRITPVGSLVNIRADHSASSADIGDLLGGHSAEGDTIYEVGTGASYQKWLNIKTLDGAAKEGWCAVIYNGSTLCTLTENAAPPPAGLPVLHISADGYQSVDMNPL